MVAQTDNFHSGHRERLRQKFIDGKMADYELLELLLGYAIPRRDVRPLARGLIRKYRSIHNVFSASLTDLESYDGIGHNTAIFIKAISQIMLIRYRAKLDKSPIFHNDQVISDYCRMLLMGKQVEEFHVLYLDINHRLIRDEMHSHGTIDWASVYPREIVKNALDMNAMSIVMLHNHPLSGRSFSTEDIVLTKDVEALLTPFGIKLYDHFLVSGDIVYSARNSLLLK